MDDVLIIGAGPTGLTLACELMSRGIPTRIIDDLPAPLPYSRALGIQPRTLEIFERMGLIEEFLKQGRKIHRMNFHIKERNFPLSFAPLPTRYPYILSLPQDKTERILERELERLGGHVERKKRLVEITGKKALVRSDAGDETINSTWIVGCDGAHSRVRHALDLSFEGVKFPEIFLLADVEIEGGMKEDGGHFFVSERGPLGILPLPEKNSFRLIFPFPPDFPFHVEEATLPFLQKEILVRSSLPLKIRSCVWTSLFYIHRRMVPQFRYGNVLLAGDAAHIHSPAGGQGMNISVQDAYNLGWKLALVAKGEADPSLLDSYDEERRPNAAKVLRMTTLITKLMLGRGLFFRLLRRLLFAFARPESHLLFALSELSLSYRKSSLAKASHCGKWSAGDRFDFPPGAACRDFLLLTAGREATTPPLRGVSQQALSSGEAAALGLPPSCQLLIRPDGYIALCGKKPDCETYLNRIFKSI